MPKSKAFKLGRCPRCGKFKKDCKCINAPAPPKIGSKAHAEAKWKQAIDLLNDIIRFKIGPSGIHGVGIIAIRDIKKGTVMEMDSLPHSFDIPYSKFNKLNKEARDMILGYYPLIVSGSHFTYPVTRFQAFLNHSDSPNYDAIKDVMLKDVTRGVEITEDYRKIKDYEQIFTWLV